MSPARRIRQLGQWAQTLTLSPPLEWLFWIQSALRSSWQEFVICIIQFMAFWRSQLVKFRHKKMLHAFDYNSLYKYVIYLRYYLLTYFNLKPNPSWILITNRTLPPVLFLFPSTAPEGHFRTLRDTFVSNLQVRRHRPGVGMWSVWIEKGLF